MARRGWSGADGAALPRRSGRRRRPWLRTAELNVVGWAALLGACAAAAVVGVVVLRASGRPGWVGLAGAVVPVLGVVVADRRHWAAMETGFGWGGSVEEVARVVAELEAGGVATSVGSHGPEEGRLVDTPDGTVTPTASLRFHNRDAKAVRAALRRHGIDLPSRMW